MTKAQATKEAKKCLKLIDKEARKHWEVKVWENLGWHWSLDALDGLFCLCPSFKGTAPYDCLLSNSDHTHAGSCAWMMEKAFADPNKAIANQVRLAHDYAIRVNDRVELATTVLDLY